MQSTHPFRFVSVMIALVASAFAGCSSSTTNSSPTTNEVARDGGPDALPDASQSNETMSESEALSTFVPQSSTGLIAVIPAEGESLNAVDLFLSSKQNGVSLTCDAADNTISTMGEASTLRITLLGLADLRATTYEILGKGEIHAGQATAIFNTMDAQCEGVFGDTDGIRATSGTIVISNVTDTKVTGRYDLTFSSGTTKGSFTVVNCTKPYSEDISKLNSSCRGT